ncbi:TM0106 family RecB-like putative nuclease [Bradyrhizobium sp. CB1650]|uniref:TM0106 family RecB-like putative nuclease n=1 Tax=Bradyrhizobium sp. CB1650 TaxID=3039153 RepID=UPI002435AC84|nr:TM0106 family RecB-like putative nuclease [Bradyrhizobium sp. CB1650]WGD53182.1 TM0106 family RecB-like putative nuclease [Bradyrhizobium sp. CB1650]
MHPLSASRLNDYLGCPHQTALWLAGIKPPEDADATLQLIRDKGFEHEAAVLARLEERFGPAERIPSGGSLADRTRLTREAIARGAKLIYQGTLTKEAWLGYPDFLVQNGDHDASTFEPEDAKLSRSAKGEYVLQLGVYAELLDDMLGIPVQGGVIHVAAGEPVRFDLRRTRFILRRLMRSFERFVAEEKRVTKSQPCAACAQCDYKARCESDWREADSPFFVAGISGAQVAKLATADVTTLAHLAALPASTKVDGMAAETLAKLSAQARLQGAARAIGQHSFELLSYARGRGFAMLPAPDDGDLYFDMEGDPLAGEGLEYLFGVYGRLNGARELAFQPIWAHSPVEEKVAFEKLMRLLMEQMRRHPNAHIYHYAAYETTALKRLAMRYATMEAELDQLLRERRFVDLYRVVVQALRASTESYSIKDLEGLYWRERSGEVQTASDSIVEYERWCLTKDNTILDSIAAYNKDDCVSTAHLHAWLEKQRPAGVNLEIVDDTAPEKREQSAERAQREARKQALAAAVRACAHGDARVRELLAELLWYHQRSQKPGWWALFERQAWSEDELVDDAESLGGLQVDTSTVPVPVKRSFDTTYVFPPQDTKLKVGDKPKIAETIGNAGAIVEISAEDGRVVLRRAAKAPPMPKRFSLVSAPIDLQGVPDAVLAFASRFASGASEDDQALLDILMRRAPRLRGRTAALPIRSADEPLTEAVIRAVTDLDHSYLFIQGPPGTGKTYTAAQAIVALLRARKRVGVSSNSHKAINKLLAEVDARAAETGFRFRGAKKGNDGKPETEYTSANVVTVVNSEDVTAHHRLVGGTVFHFCRDDQRGTCDYLFIDEAGQVSLGNLVAMGAAAANIVLVGDQMQLPQPVQGVHPGETGLSSLEYLLEDRATVADDRGILLNESRRLHPSLCGFISDAIYDGRLGAHPSTKTRYLRLRPGAHDALRPAGLSFVPIAHDGCTQSSRAEAEAIAALVRELQTHEIVRGDNVSPMTLKDILIVAPYNLQVNLLKQLLPPGAQVGTVDKFQGQEAAVVIVSMTTSRGVEAPRGTEFLFNPNRFNVAVSRAQCLALVVHGAQLLEGAWTKIDDLRRLNLFAHAESIALNRP